MFRLIFFVTLIFSQVYLIISSVVITDFGGDIYWHLRIGLDWINEGLNPFIDHYSVFHFGEKYNHLSPYLFQLFVAFLYKLFGLESALQIYKSLIPISVIIAILYFSRRQKLNSYVVATGICLVLFAFVWRLVPRPELFSYVFLIVFVFLIEELRKEFNLKKIILIGVMQTLWLNIHLSGVFGIVLVGSYIIERIAIIFLNSKDLKKTLPYVILGIVFLLIPFINPYLKNPLIVTYEFSDQWKNLISEHKNVDLINEYHLTFFSLLLLSVFTFFKTRRYYALIAVVVLLYRGILLNKVLPHLFAVSSVIFILAINDLYKTNYFNFKKLKAKYVYIVFTFILLAAEWVFVNNFNRDRLINDNQQAVKPTEAMDYFKSLNIHKGRIFNTFNVGGYIVFSMPKGMRNVIDGRTNLLYTYKDMEEVVYANLNPSRLYILDQKYNFDYAFALYSHTYDGTFDNILRSGIFSLEYAGRYSAFFSKEKNKYPIARRALIAPGCLEASSLDEINRELELALKSHKQTDLLPTILEFFKQYFQESNKEQFLYNYDLGDFYSIYKVRAYAYLLSKYEKYNTAIQVYKTVPFYLLKNTDRILVLDMILKSNNFDYHTILLNEIVNMLSRFFIYLSNAEKEYLYNILLKFKAQGLTIESE
ncbi:MAG: hypothetical protein KDD58_10845, partial [Bdellovibrionales bacterium]|nr:hypothetical protein [Bdellovibrionales bacterium]